jgi:Spy/CpxP family protein refolding chaperone
MESRMEAIQERLGLSEEQQELLEAHRTKQREAAQSLGESVQSSRESLRTELTKEDLNMENIDRLQAELKDLHARMADDRLEGMLEVRDILTPEQFAQFLELKGGCGPKKRMRHGPTDRDGQ